VAAILSLFPWAPGFAWLISAYLHIPFAYQPGPTQPPYPTQTYTDRDGILHPMSAAVDCQLTQTLRTIPLMDSDAEGVYQYGTVLAWGPPLVWHCTPRDSANRKSGDWR